MVKGLGFLPIDRHAHHFQGQTPARIISGSKSFTSRTPQTSLLSQRKIVSDTEKLKQNILILSVLRILLYYQIMQKIEKLLFHI